MAGANGFVKLHRKMVEWGWYSDYVVKDVFIHILMVAVFKPTTYRGYTLKEGQAIIGRKSMARDLGFSEQQIRTALKKLESTGEITLNPTNKFTIATVENWGFYQCQENDSNQQSTNNQPTNNQQITNNQPHIKKERKKEIYITDSNREDNKLPITTNYIKNNKLPSTQKYKNIDISNIGNEKLCKAVKDFIDHRKAIKASMTQQAYTRFINMLDKLADTDEEKIMIIDQSIFYGWKGVFEIKDEYRKLVEKKDEPKEYDPLYEIYK